jgi:histidinol-phosphatase (PHP family)
MEPYPTRSVCKEFLSMGGMLKMSDDSHGIEHVGANWEKGIEYLESLGVEELYTSNGKNGVVNSQASIRSVTLASVKGSFKA